MPHFHGSLGDWLERFLFFLLRADFLSHQTAGWRIHPLRWFQEELGRMMAQGEGILWSEGERRSFIFSSFLGLPPGIIFMSDE